MESRAIGLGLTGLGLGLGIDLPTGDVVQGQDEDWHDDENAEPGSDADILEGMPSAPASASPTATQHSADRVQHYSSAHISSSMVPPPPSHSTTAGPAATSSSVARFIAQSARPTSSSQTSQVPTRAPVSSSPEPTFGIQTAAPESPSSLSSAPSYVPSSVRADAASSSRPRSAQSTEAATASSQAVTASSAPSAKASVPVFRRPGPAKGPRGLGLKNGYLPSAPSSLSQSFHGDILPDGSFIPKSPVMDMSLASISPAQHLRQIKKRNIAARSFLGPNGGITGETIGAGAAAGGVPAMGMIPAGITNPGGDSPTLGSSPTLSPNLNMASPVFEDSHAANPLMATSIALSVVIGLLLLGVTSWAAVAYRRRHRSDNETGNRRKGISGDGEETDDAFDASNVVEKGIRHRPPSSVDSCKSITTFRPVSILFSPPSPISPEPGRRVSFVSYTSGDSISELHERLYASASPLSRIADASPEATGARPVSTMTDGSAFRSSVLESIEEEEGSVMASSSHTSISEALSQDGPQGRTESARDNVTRERSSMLVPRPASVASTSSSDSDDTHYTTASCRSSLSDATLGTLTSSLPETPAGSDFHPGDESTDRMPSFFTFPANDPAIAVVIGEMDLPSNSNASSPSEERESYDFSYKKRRAMSQTIGVSPGKAMSVEAKAMSLQPTEAMLEALRQMGEQEVETEREARKQHNGAQPVMDGPGRVEVHTAEILSTAPPSTVLGQIQVPPTLPPPPKEVKKVGFVLDDLDAMSRSKRRENRSEDEPIVPTSPSVGRSRSFPSKLLTRRSTLSKTPNNSPTIRQSEILSGGSAYLRRALKALRGEGDDMMIPGTGSIVVNLPKARNGVPAQGSSSGSGIGSPDIEGTPRVPNSTPSLGQAAFDFTAEIAARQVQLERYLEEMEKRGEDDGARSSVASTSASDYRRSETPASNVSWDDVYGIGYPDEGFDEYYLENQVEGQGNEFEYEYEEGAYSEDEFDGLHEFPLPSAHVPHIRVTTH